MPLVCSSILLPSERLLTALKVSMALVLGGFLKRLSEIVNVNELPAVMAELSPLTRKTSLEEEMPSRVVTDATLKMQLMPAWSSEVQGMV